MNKLLIPLASSCLKHSAEKCPHLPLQRCFCLDRGLPRTSETGLLKTEQKGEQWHRGDQRQQVKERAALEAPGRSDSVLLSF